MRKIEPVNFVLQRSSRAKPFVVHANKLKKCFGPTPASWLNAEQDQTREEVLADHSVMRNRSDVPELGTEVDEDFQREQVLPGNVQAPVPPPRQRRRPQYLSDYVC